MSLEPHDLHQSARHGDAGDVRWFELDDACRAVTHSSLRPIMVKARALILKQLEAAE